MIAMQKQGLASKPLVQQMEQEDLEDIEHALPGEQVAAIDTPAVRPMIDVEVVFLERWR